MNPSSVCLAMTWIAVALSGGPAIADEPQAPRALDLDEVLRIARARNRDLAAAREHLQQAATDVDRVRAALLPVAVLQTKYTHNNREIDFNIPDAAAQALGISAHNVFQAQEQVDLLVTAQVPLVVPYAYPQVRAADRAVRAQASGNDATTALLLVAVAQAFYGAAGAAELQAAGRHGVEVAARTVEDARVRQRIGAGGRVEVARAEAALLRAEQSLRETDAAAASSLRALRTLARIDGPFTIAALREPALPSLPPEAQVEEALHLRPEFTTFALQRGAAQDNLLSNRLRWLPSLSAFGIVRGFNSGGFSSDSIAAAAGLQLDWTIFDGGLRIAGERQWRSSLRETRLREEQLRDQIADEVLSLRESIEVKRLAVETAKKNVEFGRETLELVRVAYAAGISTQLDLLTAQDGLVGAEVSLARSRFDLGLADVNLRRATGALR